MNSEEVVFTAKLADNEVKINLRDGVFYATSFHEYRIREFYDEIKNMPAEGAVEIMKQWSQSKMINFWPELEFK